MLVLKLSGMQSYFLDHIDFKQAVNEMRELIGILLIINQGITKISLQGTKESI